MAERALWMDASRDSGFCGMTRRNGCHLCSKLTHMTMFKNDALYSEAVSKELKPQKLQDGADFMRRTQSRGERSRTKKLMV